MEQKYWIVADYPQIKTSEYIKEIKDLFDGRFYMYRESEADTMCPPPKEVEYTKYLATIESDKEHKGKSVKEFEKTGKKYMNLRQWLILFLQVYKTTGEFLDKDGWTLSCSRYSDGCVPRMDWDPSDRGVDVCWCSLDGSDSGGGVREQFSLFTSLPLTLEIEGKIYNKQEVIERLKELKEV